MIQIKDDYGNGTTSYFSERWKRQVNIPSELAKEIKILQREMNNLKLTLKEYEDERNS